MGGMRHGFLEVCRRARVLSPHTCFHFLYTPYSMTEKSFLEDMLLLEHSKAQTMRIVHWVGADADRLALLFEVFLGNVYRLTQRSAWAVRYVAEKHTELMAPYYPVLLEALRRKPLHDAVKRNVLYVFEALEIPPECYDDLADHCFRYLADPKEAIAVRCASMSILEKICRAIPELRSELQMLIEEHLEFGGAGFKSRGKRILGRL